MSQSQTEQQIIVSTELISLTIFQQKLMRNFFIINNRLRKLQSLSDVQNKMRNIQKELRFLTTKFDTITQKIPKDGNCITKKQAQTLFRDQFFEIMDDSQDKIKQTQTYKAILSDIQKIRMQSQSSSNKNYHHSANHKQSMNRQTSFTAGTILLSQAKKNHQPSKQLLRQVLSKEQSIIVNQIIAEGRQQPGQVQNMKKDIQKLYDIIDNLKLGIGYQHFVDKQLNQYEKMERTDSKSNQGGRKKKSTTKRFLAEEAAQYLPLPSIAKLVSFSKEQFYVQTQRNLTKNRMPQNFTNMKSQMAMKQDFMKRKTNQQINTPTQITLLNKQQLSNDGMFTNETYGNPARNEKNNTPSIQNYNSNKSGQPTKIQQAAQNRLFSKTQRSKSLKKMERFEKKLRCDDMRDLNAVLKQIELRIQKKGNQDIFNQYVKQLEEKIQILRITKDPTNQLNDLRKMVYNLDNKLQYIISYLQSMTNQDDALIVKKNWTCISCDKMVDKFTGKVGQHLNWDSIQPKKTSTVKIGAFGQAGQLANKIKNLMQNPGAQ